MYIKGKLVVAQNNWKNVYSSILNFINEEIEVAYECALQIYKRSKSEDFTSFEQEIANFTLSKFQLATIKKSLYKKGADKIYKPNKPAKATNRISSIDLIDYVINVDKVTNTIDFTSSNFDCTLEQLIQTDLFIEQFLTMVESIDWPTRTGPVKAIRGCKIIYIKDNKSVEFYSAGSNPPAVPFEHTIVTREPTFLSTTQLKTVSNHALPLQKEEHYQEIQLIDPELY